MTNFFIPVILVWLLRSACAADPKGTCVLPPFPANGKYEADGVQNPSPGQTLQYAVLTYSCARGYQATGSERRLCVQGVWTANDFWCKSTTPFLSRPSNESQGACILPPQPENGMYKVNGIELTSPGQAFDYVGLNYSCDRGYGLFGSKERLCVQGVWADEDPKCVRICWLRRHSSVVYNCEENNITRNCRNAEPEGSIVIPRCRTPYYSSPGIENFPMRCNGGRWNYIATCEPDCGRLPKDIGDVDSPFIVPWNAGIYRKTDEGNMLICGGTLINPNIVVSSAQCFWNSADNAPEEPKNYAVALGKVYRKWHKAEDLYAQNIEVADIKLPPFYRGAASNYQDDIAVVWLTRNIEYTQQVRPVCIQVAFGFEQQHLKTSNLGMIASWFNDSPQDEGSSKLKALYLPYVPQEECLSRIDPSLISSDTFCAGFENGTALCSQNRGAGIVFPVDVKGVVRYFFHGIASVRSTEGNCSGSWLTTFTQVSRHDHFIRSSIIRN